MNQALAPAATQHGAEVSAGRFEKLETSSPLGKYAVYIILAYLSAGVAFYSMVEGWDYSDALYFCVVTMTTVGYGDLTPTEDASKLFTVCYILIGLSLVATSLGVLVGELQGTVDAVAATAPASKKQKYLLQFLRSAAAIVVLLGVGAAAVAYAEDWTALDSIYWAVVTASSVGYGDVVSTSPATRAFMTFYMLVAVGGCALSMSKFGSIIMEIEADRQVERFVGRGVTEGMINDMDGDGSGSIDKSEFLAYMLVAMGKVQQADVDKVVAMFDELDADGSGALDVNDVRAYNSTRRQASGGGPGHGMANVEEGMSRGMGIQPLKKPLLS